MQPSISSTSNDYDIDLFAKNWVEENIEYINKIRPTDWRDKTDNNSQLPFLAFKEQAYQTVKRASYSFINNNHDSSYLNKYLFKSLNAIVDNDSNLSLSKGMNAYICPGCKFLGAAETMQVYKDRIACNRCMNKLNDAHCLWEEYFYLTYSQYHKKGYKCDDCLRFIPDKNSKKLICPYPDCLFVGERFSMKKMRHPMSKWYKYGIQTLSDADISNKIRYSSDNRTDAAILAKEEIEKYVSIINECIDTQSTMLQFRTDNMTLINKLCMYQAYKNVMEKYPQEIISYLVFMDRTIRIQHKIFQEYVSILEQRIPFTYKSNNSLHTVKSLFDDNLCLFYGESEFSATINKKLEICNNTKEIYVGGRKAAYCKPFYMGKIIDIINTDNNCSILPLMKEHTFSKIVMTNEIVQGTNVLVRHHRIPPHHQMGSMVYLNRIRRKLVDKIYFILNGKKREINAENNSYSF